MTASIVVVGSINMDLMLNCPHLPQPGETVLGEDFATAPGGKGANQAVAAARLGAAVSLIACVGDDEFGRAALAALAAEGVDVNHVSVQAGVRTGVAVVLVDRAGENCIALAGGANAALSIERIDAAAPVIAQAALLVCQLESPLAAVQRAMQIASEHGVPVLLNPAPAQPLSDADLACVDFLVPNVHEALLLDGHDAGAGTQTSVAALTATAERLRERGARNVIVTRGAEGVICASHDATRHWLAPHVQTVDTTGAGDTFVGAFAVARSEGQSVETSIAFAQRAAALSTTRRGAQAAMPRRAELDDPSAPTPEAPA